MWVPAYPQSRLLTTAQRGSDLFADRLAPWLLENQPFAEIPFSRDSGGLLLPLLGVFVLTALLFYGARRHWRQAADRERRQTLALHLGQLQDLGELARYLAHFPATCLPIARTSVYLYDHAEARRTLAAAWPPAARALTTHPSASACQTCLASRTHGLRRCLTTPRSDDRAASRPWCLPLRYESLLVGILQLTFPADRPPAALQLRWLEASSAEIALALVRALGRNQQLALARANAQAAERNRLAHLLHHSLAQQLSYLHFGLDHLANTQRPPDPERLRADLERLRLVAHYSYTQVRDALDLLTSARPFDLTLAVEHYASFLAQTANLALTFTACGRPTPLPAELCQPVFGLIQEGLHNAQKHAQARSIWLSLAWSPDSLRIEVTDDGIGFDPTALPAKGHFGLPMVQESVTTLGGQLTLESAPGRGTRLAVLLPLARESYAGDEARAGAAGASEAHR